MAAAATDEQTISREKARYLAAGLAERRGQLAPRDHLEILEALNLGVSIAGFTVTLCNALAQAEDERGGLRREREALVALALRSGATPAEVSATLDGAAAQRGERGEA